MKLKRIGARVEHTFRFDVEGARPLKLMFRASSILPEKVTVTFSDGDWVETKISGRHAKKDGTAGLDYHTQGYVTCTEEDMPAWARSLMDFDYTERLAGGGDGESSAG